MSYSRYTRLATGLYARTIARYLSRKRCARVKPWLEGDVLDIGCGGESSLADHLAGGQRYVGIDVQEAVIQALREQKPEWEFHCIDIEQDGRLLDVVRSEFDTIVLLAVIEHLHDPTVVLKQCRALLKPGGHLVITTPSAAGDRLVRAFKRLLGVKHEELEMYSPHQANYNERTLQEMVAGDGHFRIECYKTFEFGLNQLVVASG